MTRFFYSDPLAAAWMAREFGMRFSWSTDTYFDDVALPTSIISDENKGYIQNDSLHLLEPQVGDLLRGDEASIPQIRYMDLPDEEQMGAGSVLMRRGFKIIQRNGVPFHWPEQEAA